jgi:hypothetical protein
MTERTIKDAVREPSGRPAYPFDAGSTFVLAAGGLRRLHGRGEAFMGYEPGEIFWIDALDLVHEKDLARAGRLISGAVGNPYAVLNAGLRLRDAAGGWRTVKATVRTIVEAPGDDGLVLAELREASATDDHAGPRHPRR